MNDRLRVCAVVFAVACAGAAAGHTPDNAVRLAETAKGPNEPPASTDTKPTTSPTTTERPNAPAFKPVGLFFFKTSKGNATCTGQFIAPRIVLTAAHCIQDNTTGEWYPTSNMRFWLQYHNGSYSREYRVACAARLNSWMPKVKSDATDEEKLAAMLATRQYDFAMLLVNSDSVGGVLKVALDAAGKYPVAVQVGYPGAIAGGKVVQEDPGFSGMSYFPANVSVLWHLNEKMTQGTSGGAWIGKFGDNGAPDSNIIIGVTSFGNELWPRTTFGPYLRNKEFNSLLSYVSRGCPRGGNQ